MAPKVATVASGRSYAVAERRRFLLSRKLELATTRYTKKRKLGSKFRDQTNDSVAFWFLADAAGTRVCGRATSSVRSKAEPWNEVA